MKRAAGWAAIAALVVGMLGMALWLWPQFRPSGLQRQSSPLALTARTLPGEPAKDARVQATESRELPQHSDARGSCRAWFDALKTPLEAKALQAQSLAAQARGEAELNQLLAEIANTGTPGERAAALYLKVEGQAKQVSLDFSAKNPECRADSQCDVKLSKAVGKATGDDINTIARMAVTSRDPKLYGLAFSACGRVFRQAPSYCAQISADQWTQRDPDNGTAWLYAAAAASKEGRESDKAEAIYRLTQTKRFDLGVSLLSDLARSEALHSATPFVASTATGWANHGHMLSPLDGYLVVMAHCTLATVRDANRAQVCNDLAHRLLGDDTALISPILGFRLGERLAWPAPRLAAIKEELDALRAVQGETMELLFGDSNLTNEEDFSPQGLAGCEAMDKSTAFLNTQMRVGEVQELRDRLANHKLSRAALAAQYARKNPAKR